MPLARVIQRYQDRPPEYGLVSRADKDAPPPPPDPSIKWTIYATSLIGREAQYATLAPGQTLYARSGHRVVITSLPGYPRIVAQAEDVGPPVGDLTADMGEAAQWALAQADKETEFSTRKDGWLLTVSASNWYLRVRPYKERIKKLRALSDDVEKWRGAWEIIKEIQAIRGQSTLDKSKATAKASVGAAVETVKDAEAAAVDAGKNAIGAAVGSMWEQIPIEAKIGGVVVGGGLALFALHKLAD